MPTNNPLPSSNLEDFKDNSIILDHFVNSQDNEYPDRFNRKRPTITGIIKEAFNVRTDISNMNETLIGQSRWDAVPKNTSLSLGGDNGALNKQAQALFNRTVMLKAHAREALRRTYLEAGLNLVEGSFETGAIITSTTDVVLHEKTGKCYSGPIGQVSKETDPLSEGFVDVSEHVAMKFVTYHSLRSYRGPSINGLVCGRERINDNGGGYFVADYDDVTSPDNDGTILVDLLGRRWKRQFSGKADVRWWGVVGNGVTSDSVTLGRAIASYKSLTAWPEARILLTKIFDDGSVPTQQYQSYAVLPTADCTLDLAGGAIVRAAVGEGDMIDMYKSFIVNTGVKFRIENGVIDMNNHNGRFALFYKSLPDSGIYNCTFINTRNNGTPRTAIPNSAEIVAIKDCVQVYCDDCKYYVGSEGDLSGNVAPSYDNPSFGVRITSKFVTNESAQTENTVNCAVRRCEFWGPFTWQPVEIAGTGTRSCYMKNILMYKPVLSMVDLDKGCKRCYAEDIEIRFPGPGIVGAPAGGDGFIPIRFQGYRVGSDVVYTENCWADNIHIYGLPYSQSTSSFEMLGTLVVSSDAVNCKATNITVHGDGIIRSFLGAEPNSDLVLEHISARAAQLTQSPSPSATLNDCNISLTEVGLIVSPAYLNSNDVKIAINGGVYKYIGSGTPNFFQGYEQTLGQPSIEIFGTVTLGWNSFVRATGTTQLNNVRFVGNNSKQKIPDVYSTIPAGNKSGNNTVLF